MTERADRGILFQRPPSLEGRRVERVHADRARREKHDVAHAVDRREQRPEAIAECDVECEYPDGRRVPLKLAIGKPQPWPQGDWQCPVRTLGPQPKLRNIRGVDSWQALQLALRFLEALLSAEVDRGAVLYWPTADERITVPELFGQWRGTDNR